jgi:hypothetical protein
MRYLLFVVICVIGFVMWMYFGDPNYSFDSDPLISHAFGDNPMSDIAVEETNIIFNDSFEVDDSLILSTIDFDTFTFAMDTVECDKFTIEFVIEGISYKYPCKELKTIILANKPTEGE